MAETKASLVERVTELRAWATNRIEWCRREELKFGAGSVSIEASIERRALQATLKILDDGEDASGERAK